MGSKSESPPCPVGLQAVLAAHPSFAFLALTCCLTYRDDSGALLASRFLERSSGTPDAHFFDDPPTKAVSILDLSPLRLEHLPRIAEAPCVLGQGRALAQEGLE